MQPPSSPTTTPTNTIRFSTPILAPPDKVFTALISLHTYSDWLPPSDVFHGTSSISDTPIRVGTTYVEHDVSGTRYGRVLELDPFPDEGDEGDEKASVKEGKVVFHQPMRLKPEFLGVVVDVLVTMRVRREGKGSIVDREIRLGMPMVLWVVKGWVAGLFERESRRSMGFLKMYLEAKEERKGAVG
jgi:uncharacterized protein YndB with AHSA1/START domain